MPDSSLDDRLLAACGFARCFIEAADREVRGGSSLPRREAQEQLIAALRAIEEEEWPEVNAQDDDLPY